MKRWSKGDLEPWRTRKFITDKASGAVFDDFVKQPDDDSYDFDTEYWTQVCNKCAIKYKLAEVGIDLDLGAGSGICGVKGCRRQADHYYDFNPKQEV